MSLLDTINEAWGWTGLVASRVRAQSPMGHLLVSDLSEQFFYIDPDGMAVLPLGTREEAQAHLDGPEANELWWGGELVSAAREILGEPPEGSVLCLNPRAMLEGDYKAENMCIMQLDELIAFSGDAARQIKGLPDGSQFQIKIVD